MVVGVHRLPCWANRLTPQHHAGFARRTIDLSLVAPHACQHTVGPVRHATLSARHDVVDRELVCAWLVAAVLPISPHKIAPLARGIFDRRVTRIAYIRVRTSTNRLMSGGR